MNSCFIIDFTFFSIIKLKCKLLKFKYNSILLLEIFKFNIELSINEKNYKNTNCTICFYINGDYPTRNIFMAIQRISVIQYSCRT